jgi:hypothetical protein
MRDRADIMQPIWSEKDIGRRNYSGLSTRRRRYTNSNDVMHSLTRLLPRARIESNSKVLRLQQWTRVKKAETV